MSGRVGCGRPVRVHDFPGDAIGKAIPYGVYDMARNEAWVSVGRDHDTPAFAVASIRQWWTMMGRAAYPQATDLLITADAGGSNGYRSRTWKQEVQRLADDLRLVIHVSHFPPASGTRSSIASSATSRRTGEAVPSAPLRPWSTSSATRAQWPACE